MTPLDFPGWEKSAWNQAKTGVEPRVVAVNFSAKDDKMRLESAMNSSREGIQAHGSAISVVGDNISNASTTGFKESRVEFSDLLSQGTDGNRGDIVSNGRAGGSGTQIQAVRQLFTNGAIEATGREFDIAIDGNGFLISGSTDDPVYTRAGNLEFDTEGVLITADGNPVLGYQGTATTLGTINLKDIDIAGTPTSALTIVNNMNSTAAIGTAPANPATFRELRAAATDIGTATVYDSLGQEHSITLAYTKTGVNTWTVQGYIDGGEVGGTAGQPVQLGQNATLTFSSSGVIETANQAAAKITGAPAYGNGAAAGNFSIDFSSNTQLGGSFQVLNISQDGQGTGNIKGYEFRKNGDIFAQLDSGTSVKVGSLRLADFPNRDGLVRAGNSGFKATDKSGVATDAAPGSGGTGEIVGASLERSTVDLANQFVNLVVYQRGYQASSQVLTAASQAIRDTIQLIR